jgi:uncharacterized protein (UPF0332 family)
MKSEEIELVRHRLARAQESLQEADLLLMHGHLQTAVNRIYYACFYAVSALLLIEKHSSPKHSGIRSLFDQHWIKADRLPRDMGRLYRRLFDMRQKSDYMDLFKVDADEVRALLQETTKFVDTISRIIDDMIPKPS